MTNRRDVIKLGAGAGLVLGAGGLLKPRSAAAQSLNLKPEPGAKLRVLRWKRFVQGDEVNWLATTKKYADANNIEIRVDSENWEDVRPKAAVAAQVGSGPDIIIGTNDDPQKFPSKLVDISDVAEYLGAKYGGWYDVCKRYGQRDGKWIALPMGAAGACLVHRKSHIQKAGFEEIPKDTAGFLKLCQALQKNGTPAGFALGHATGDANTWCNWALWSHGGMVVNPKNEVVLDSPETVAALEYVKQLYATFVPGTLSWLDPSNNKAFLSGECSLTNNGISVYYAAKTSDAPAMQEMAKDIFHANFPVGPVGKPTEFNLMFQAFVFQYSKFPNAAKDYLRFMWEREQFVPWMEASIGYVSHPLRAYEDAPVWTADPKATPYRDSVKVMLDNGYSGTLGENSAAVISDFVVVDMFASVCAGTATPKEAAAAAAEKAKRIYKA